MRGDKALGLVPILGYIKAGLNPSEISEKYKIPKQSINYYVDKLLKLGCIEKRGYGTWAYIKQVPILTIGTNDSQIGTSHKKEIRGHAFIWKIEFSQEMNWEKIRSTTIRFSRLHNGKTIRCVYQDKKIWLTVKGMIIYEPLDFMGRSSFEVKGTAVFEMDLLIKNLLKALGLPFVNYRFTTSREHYAQIKNELAKQYNDRKEKMYVKNQEGTTWLWIDHSDGEQELETNNDLKSVQVQKFWNSHDRNGFKVDADFVLKGMASQNEAIEKTTKNLDYYAENMKSHISAIKTLDSSVAKLTEIIERLDKK